MADALAASGQKRDRSSSPVAPDADEPEAKRPRLEQSTAANEALASSGSFSIYLVDLGLVKQRTPLSSASLTAHPAAGETQRLPREAKPRSPIVVSSDDDDDGDGEDSAFDVKKSDPESSSSSGAGDEEDEEEEDADEEEEEEEGDEDEEAEEGEASEDSGPANAESQPEALSEDSEVLHRLTVLTMPAGGLLVGAVQEALQDAVKQHNETNGESPILSLIVRYLRGVPLSAEERAQVPATLVMVADPLPDRGVAFHFSHLAPAHAIFPQDRVLFVSGSALGDDIFQ
jgi:hypothetical protein